MKSIAKIKNNIFFVYTVIFAVIAIIIFLPYLLRGNGFVALTDSYHEVFPTFVYIREYIENLVRGNGIQVDFRIGLGDDVLFTLAYMGVLDVLSVISVFLFPTTCVEAAFYFSIILKLYMSGIGFIFFVRKYVKEDFFILCGALLYAFQTFTLFNGLDFPPYLLVRVTLPFVLKGVDEVCENRKLSFDMILGLLVQGLMGFYCLYIEILIVIIYFVLIMFFRYGEEIRRDFKVLVKKISNMFLNGILGVGLSCIVLIPSLISMSYSIRQLEEGERFRLFCDWETFFATIGDLCVPNVYGSPTTLSLIAVLAVIVCIFSRKVRKEIRYIPLVLWVLSFSPFMGSVMNGFSYSNIRWYFAVGLFAAIATTVVLEAEEKLDIKETIIYYIIVFGTFFVHFINNEKNFSMFLRMGFFVVFALILPYVWNSKKRERNILCYTSILIIGMGLFTFGPKVLGGSGYSANFHKVGVYDEIKEDSAGLEKTREFERWDLYDSSFNAAMVADYYGASEYFSTINKYVAEFYQEMCISPGIRDALNILRGLDARQEMISLLSVSQYMDFTTTEERVKKSSVMKNDEFIPLGFTYDSYMTRKEFDALNPMEKSSQIFNSVVLEAESKIGTKVESGNYENKEINFDVSYEIEDGVRVYIDAEEYISELEERLGEIYVRIDDFHGDADVFVGNKEIRIRMPSFLYYTGIEEYWFNLTEIKENTKGYYFDIYFDGTTDFTEEKLSVWWHPIDYHAIDSRQESTLENLDVRTNVISGTIDCEDNKILFLSIPYSKGWKAYVDDQETELLKANIGFMALPLGTGEHRIELEYRTPGLNVGMVISIVSFVCILVLCYLSKKDREKKKNEI